MTPRELMQILRQIGVTDAMFRSESQASISCPLAPWLHKNKKDDNPSLSIKHDKCPTVFKCFACGESGTLAHLVRAYGSLASSEDALALADRLSVSDKPDLRTKLASAMLDSDEWVSPPTKTPVLDEDVLQNFTPLLLAKPAMAYLEQRGIPFSTACRFGLMYDSRLSRVLFPARDLQGGLKGLVGRTLIDEHPKYKNYFGFKSTENLGGGDQCREDNDVITVVEGFMCILKAYEWAMGMGSDIVCTWTAVLHDAQADQILGLGKRVLMCYDNDTAGEKGYKEAAQKLKRRCPIQKGQFTTEDVGAMNKSQFVHMFQDARARRLQLRA